MSHLEPIESVPALCPHHLITQVSVNLMRVISAYTRTDAIKYRNTCLTSIRCQCGWFASKSLGVLSNYYNVDGFSSSVDIKLKGAIVFAIESTRISLNILV